MRGAWICVASRILVKKIYEKKKWVMSLYCDGFFRSETSIRVDCFMLMATDCIAFSFVKLPWQMFRRDKTQTLWCILRIIHFSFPFTTQSSIAHESNKNVRILLPNRLLIKKTCERMNNVINLDRRQHRECNQKNENDAWTARCISLENTSYNNIISSKGERGGRVEYSTDTRHTLLIISVELTFFFECFIMEKIKRNSSRKLRC